MLTDNFLRHAFARQCYDVSADRSTTRCDVFTKSSRQISPLLSRSPFSLIGEAKMHRLAA